MAPSEREFKMQKLERRARQMEAYNKKVQDTTSRRPDVVRVAKVDELLSKGATGNDIKRMGL